MTRKYKVDPALLIDTAVRMETMGYGGVEYQGSVRSSAELRRMVGEPVFPLPPFNAYLYYMNKDGSSGQRGH